MTSASNPDIILVLKTDPFTKTEGVFVMHGGYYLHFIEPPNRVEVRFHPTIVDDIFVPGIVILFLYIFRGLPCIII